MVERGKNKIGARNCKKATGFVEKEGPKKSGRKKKLLGWGSAARGESLTEHRGAGMKGTWA